MTRKPIRDPNEILEIFTPEKSWDEVTHTEFTRMMLAIQTAWGMKDFTTELETFLIQDIGLDEKDVKEGEYNFRKVLNPNMDPRVDPVKLSDKIDDIIIALTPIFDKYNFYDYDGLCRDLRKTFIESRRTRSRLEEKFDIHPKTTSGSGLGDSIFVEAIEKIIGKISKTGAIPVVIHEDRNGNIIQVAASTEPILPTIDDEGNIKTTSLPRVEWVGKTPYDAMRVMHIKNKDTGETTPVMVDMILDVAPAIQMGEQSNWDN